MPSQPGNPGLPAATHLWEPPMPTRTAPTTRPQGSACA